MERVESSKIIAIFIMFVAALFFGLIPVKLRHLLQNNSRVSKRSSDIGLSFCLCFGAGVLLATVFLHIYPESRKAFDTLMTMGEIKRLHYPICELTLCLGFLLMYLMEELAHWVAHKHPMKEKKCDSLSTVVVDCDSNCLKEMSLDVKTFPADNISLKCVDSCENGVNIGETITSDDLESSAFRTILVVLALSFHGCFEGIELGLEATSFGVWSFCLAICLHKIFLAFSMGMELSEIGIKGKMFYIYIITFAIAAPTGALAGLILYSNIQSDDIGGKVAIAVLQAIAGGAILFVVFCEVLERERMKTEGRIVHFLGLLIGFVLMASLQLVHPPNSEYANGNQNSTFYIR